MSSLNITLKRGLNSLIHVNSSVRASTSERTTVHCTALAVVTICWVRGCRFARSWK